MASEADFEKFFSRQLPQGPITRKNEGKVETGIPHLRHGLQVLLCIRTFPNQRPTDADQNEMVRWSEKYADRYRKIFDRKIAHDPNFFEGYATLKDIPETVLRDFERELYNEGQAPDDIQDELELAA